MAEKVMEGVWRGNAIVDGQANGGWVVGSRQPQDSPLYDPNVGFKFHQIEEMTASRSRDQASADPTSRTYQFLISGRVRTSFIALSGNPEDDVHVKLTELGDVCVWDPDVMHYWEVNPGTDGKMPVVLTLRFPVKS